MAKVKVSICTGTACYVMGASELLLLEEELPEELKDKVEIEGVMCLELCKSNPNSNSKPPFVTIDNEIMAEATLQGVLDKIRKKIC
ncbi:MAG: hypothetical protein R3Y36_03585 [Spirochaetales bacterium]